MRNVQELAALSLLLAGSLFGQVSSLTGTIADPAGAAVPNAAITLSNSQTGLKRETVSDTQGRYTIPELAPGKYNMQVSAPGFAESRVNSIELLVNQPATVAVKLEIGTASTAVAVEASATQVNTVDASLGNVINNQAITELPSYARNIVGLLAQQPGVTLFGSPGQGTNGGNNLDYRSGSVNGGKADQTNVTLDGADVNDQNGRAAFTTVLRVTVDSVEEFRSTTSLFDAASGRGSGADVALVTKSGTNGFHGSLYEFRRGTETAANSFFSNRSGVPIAPLLINLFGGTAGGAIKKNKLFYFINYEGRRDRSSASVTETIPTETMKQGIILFHDKSGALQQIGPAQIQQIDPGGIGVSTSALKALQALPVGNDTALGDGLNSTGYLFNAPVASDQNTYIAKIDYKIDSAGKHSIFWRGNLQNDAANGTPQFPGQPPNSVTLNNSKGFAAGWTAVLKPTLVSNFHYGLTRYGNQSTGVLTQNYEWFRGYSTPYGTSTGTTRIIPTHTLSEDMSWNHGAHDLRFGAIVRLISNQSVSYANSFSSATSNPSWLNGSGNDLTGALSIASGDLNSYEYGIGALLGLEAQGTAHYNYLVDGTVIPTGAPVSRDFVNHEAELYVQDTWKVTHNLTVTAGLRYSLEPPVYEANGQQASTNIPLAAWLADRANLAAQGQSQSGAPLITFLPYNGAGGRSMYPYHKNWAPRVGIAYSPKGTSGLSRLLFGSSGQTSIRAGAGMYYDLIGQPLAQSFNSTQFGLSSSLSNPANILNSAQVPRYTSFYSVPGVLVPAAPAGGLPRTYPTSGTGSFAIANSIDDNLKSPYSINLDFNIGRQFGKGFFVQAGYVGRLSRHSLIQRDLAMPTDLVDPKSGQDYFSAMTQLANLMDYSGVTIGGLPKIPFFENMWAGAAGFNAVYNANLSATQVWGLDYKGDATKGIKGNSNPGDFTNTLNNADNSANCSTTGTKFKSTGGVSSMSCGVLGAFMIFNPQFSALSANSSIGKGDYHAMQWTFQKRFGTGLQFDVNYTLSKSIDLASTTEGGTYSGFVINTWDPSQMRAVSAYDTLHQINADFVYQLPFGRGRKYGHDMSKLLDVLFGGWEISGLYRQTSGLPLSIINGQRWPTNWEVDANATPNGQPLPAVVSTGNASTGVPNLWQNPALAFAGFNETMPGQSGLRDNLRGNGIFNIDSGVFKSFTMPYSEHHRLQFRWESFNLTNSVRFDPQVSSTNGSVLISSSFGKLSSTLGNPRQMQFALKYLW